jgi:hypothetical protein
MIVTTKTTALMKQLILLITLTFFYQAAFSQGVGINTITPDPSAALDIQSSNKGLLVPRVALTSLTDKTTILNPANALLVYNTNTGFSKGAGYYYNAGTPGSPSWKSLSEFNLPFYGATSPAGAAFQVDNYNGSIDAVALKGFGSGNGTGVYAQSGSRFALQVDGGLRIFGNGQVPGEGKVLTSGSTGDATWQDVPKLPDVAFRATMSDLAEVIPPNQAVKVNFGVEEYDLGNNYTDINGNPSHTFTVPMNGIYHFEAQVKLVFGVAASELVSISIIKVKNGIETILVLKSQQEAVVGAANNATSADLKLETGDQIIIRVQHSADENATVHSNAYSSFFNGRLVMKL